MSKDNRWRPMESAKDCSMYLGIYIAERALSKFFDHIERMPINNPGFDFICGRGFKIDAKSSTMHNYKNTRGYKRWEFHIKRNMIADYFLCLAFDDRENLTPMHVWLIPGDVVGTKKNLQISNSPVSLAKWSQYERPLDRVLACCQTMKVPG